MEINNLYVPTIDDQIVWEVNDTDLYHWVEKHTVNLILEIDSLLKLTNPDEIKYVFKSNGGNRFEVFAEDMLEIIKHLDHGVIAGTFVFVKHENRYGIKLFHPSI